MTSRSTDASASTNIPLSKLQPTTNSITPVNETPSFDYLLKFLLVGDSGAGKTSALTRFVDDRFDENFVCTIGVELRLKCLPLLEGRRVKLQMWDIAGLDRFQTITSSYYRGVHAVLLLYDICDIRTFQHVQTRWLGQIQKHSPPNIPVLLVGNKLDSVEHSMDKRQVERKEAEQFAKEHGMEFIETSAKIGTNIQQAFIQLASCVFARNVIAPYAETAAGRAASKVVTLNKEKQKSKCGA
jgi:small GTP-binding protein